jgi:hypothetical protein
MCRVPGLAFVFRMCGYAKMRAESLSDLVTIATRLGLPALRASVNAGLHGASLARGAQLVR